MNKGWKKLGAAAIIGLLIIVIAGCVEEGKVRTPEDTIEEFVNYYNDRDADSLYALFSDKVRSEHPIEEIESNLEAAKTFGVKITKWEIVGKEEIGNVVILKVSTTTEGGFSPGTEISTNSSYLTPSPPSTISSGPAIDVTDLYSFCILLYIRY